jgi:hypothetical protein
VNRMMCACGLAAVLGVGLGARVARADEVVLVPPLDGTLYELEFDDSANGVGSQFFVGKTSVGWRRRSVLKFDFSSIPSGSTINSVSLSLSLDRSHGGSMATTLHRVSASWGEGASNAGNASNGAGAVAMPGDVTWHHRFYPDVLWNTPGGDFDATSSASTTVSGANFYTWSSNTMKADVQNWLNNPAANFGWLLKSPETTNGTAKRFISGDSFNTFQVPMLTVNYTPPVACPADLDNGSGNGTPDGGVDVNDLLYFLVQFEAGAVAADLDNGSGTGTPDGGVDINDLLYFLVRFEGGC